MNFKSLNWCGDHVEAFCEVKNTPLYGCLTIRGGVAPPAGVISTLPVSEKNTFQSSEDAINTIAYSVDSVKYTGCSNVIGHATYESAVIIPA